MLTHVVFGAGAAAAMVATQPIYVGLYFAVTLSLLVNPVLDWLGHFRRGPFVSRSPLTHSLLTAPVWGAGVGYFVWYGLSEYGRSGIGLAFFVYAGVAVALAHLLLDALTEKGVFILDKRVALAHFRSGNRVLNGAFLVLGIGLILVAAQSYLSI